LVEADSHAFGRASHINQARVQQRYYYPRSLTTARVSASFFDRFNKDFGLAINQKFKKIYCDCRFFQNKLSDLIGANTYYWRITI
jgi:hypothetical protein